MRNHLGGGSRALVVLALTLVATVTGWNVPADAGTPTPGAARYRVSLTADDTGTVWRGRESVTFTNTGAASLDHVWFRLWANGPGRCTDPAITITRTIGGQWASPIVGCTAVRVDLARDLNPASSATLAFRFTLRVPHHDGRFGNADGVSLLGNALPILAVHDGAGWHLDPYVGFADSFYSLASSFRVTVDAPNALDIATTGAEVDRATVGRTHDPNLRGAARARLRAGGIVLRPRGACRRRCRGSRLVPAGRGRGHDRAVGERPCRPFAHDVRARVRRLSGGRARRRAHTAAERGRHGVPGHRVRQPLDRRGGARGGAPVVVCERRQRSVQRAVARRVLRYLVSDAAVRSVDPM